MTTDIRAYAAALVADWPALSPEQRARLASLLAPYVARTESPQ